MRMAPRSPYALVTDCYTRTKKMQDTNWVYWLHPANEQTSLAATETQTEIMRNPRPVVAAVMARERTVQGRAVGTGKLKSIPLPRTLFQISRC